MLTRMNHFFQLKKNRKEPLCYAPFNNLLIDQQGKLKICCHNYTYILGIYSENNIDEIWFGENRKKIISQFLNSEIPPSCLNCINSGLNIASPDSKVSDSVKNTSIRFDQYPAQIEFLLDNTCNLNCIMCSPNNSSASSAQATLFKKVFFDDEFIYQLKPFLKNTEFFVFSGGEPFLIPIYSKIWDVIHTDNPGASIYIQTNATILNEQIKQKIKYYKMDIGVSIDSISKELYETIRRNAHFETTFENLDYFIQHTRSLGKRLSLTATPMTLNAHEIPQIVEFCNTKDIKFSLSILEEPLDLAIWALSSAEINKLVVEYKAFHFTSNTNCSVFKENIQSFQNFLELIEKYAQRKTFFETKETEILVDILNKSVSIAENFDSSLQEQINRMNLSKEEKEKMLERSKRLNVLFYNQFSPFFDKSFYFYSLFIRNEISFFINHLLYYNDTVLEKIMDEKMKELSLMFKTKSYDRIIDIDE